MQDIPVSGESLLGWVVAALVFVTSALVGWIWRTDRGVANLQSWQRRCDEDRVDRTHEIAEISRAISKIESNLAWLTGYCQQRRTEENE